MCKIMFNGIKLGISYFFCDRYPLHLIMAISIVFLFGCTKEIQKWLCHIILVDDADRITNSCYESPLIVVFSLDTNRFHTICIE